MPCCPIVGQVMPQCGRSVYLSRPCYAAEGNARWRIGCISGGMLSVGSCHAFPTSALRRLDGAFVSGDCAAAGVRAVAETELKVGL